MPDNVNQFASSLSTASDLHQAIEECCDSIGNTIDGAPNFVTIYAAQHDQQQTLELGERIKHRLGCDFAIGCTGESVIGPNREIELRPGLSLMAAKLPNTSLQSFHLELQSTSDGNVLIGWPLDLADTSFLLTHSDPFSFPTDYFLECVHEEYPQLPIFGGVASAAQSEGESRLFCNAEVFDNGAVVLAAKDGIQFSAIVSQGCRPIGQPMIITKAERNMIFQLGGRPVLDQLNETFELLPNSEKRMVQNGLHLGRVINEYQSQFEHGDFLVRNVIGIDQENQAIMVGDYFQIGQTVQFHLRDESSAHDDLEMQIAKDGKMANPKAALLFSCTGRGTRMFSDEHHDAKTLARIAGDLPVAGFFAQGELGPVGGRNFVHGYTASILLMK